MPHPCIWASHTHVNPCITHPGTTLAVSKLHMSSQCHHQQHWHLLLLIEHSMTMPLIPKLGNLLNTQNSAVAVMATSGMPPTPQRSIAWHKTSLPSLGSTPCTSSLSGSPHLATKPHICLWSVLIIPKRNPTPSVVDSWWQACRLYQ